MAYPKQSPEVAVPATLSVAVSHGQLSWLCSGDMDVVAGLAQEGGHLCQECPRALLQVWHYIHQGPSAHD